jgi:hypothetical protein
MYDELLPFASWKECLRQDCVRLDKLVPFNALGDECLRLLWESGTQPSVQGIIQGRDASAITGRT